MNWASMIPGPSLLYRAIAVALLASAFGTFCWFKGREGVQEAWNEEKVARATATEKLRAARTIVVHATQIKYRDRIKEIEVAGATIEKEVIRYVTKDDDAACELRAGFVRVYDAGLRNEPTGPANDTDREPSGVALSDATQAITRNNTTLAICRERLKGWSEFYDNLRKAK